MLALVWPFIHVRWRRRTELSTRPAVTDGPVPPTLPPLVSGRVSKPLPTILRSLILFNVLFAVQTVLDGVYLWGPRCLTT